MTESVQSFDKLADQCAQLKSEMQFKQLYPAPVIEFSNTGRRGLKFFVLPLPALIQTLKDIRNNFNAFQPIKQYVETPWRDTFSENLTDKATLALSTVQTLPLFATIAKVIHVTNNLPPHEYQDGSMALTLNYLDKTIAYLSSQIPDENMFKDSKPVSAEKTVHAVNRIYYGAPGTGKSYAIDQEVIENNSIRIVFHADTQYTDFVGCLKPAMTPEGLTYEFSPGPFTNALLTAMRNPSKHYWLIIEEINRASAAAVFGEIFQLLDRESDGSSKYGITPSDPELINYLQCKLESNLVNGKIRIPSNLSILATMNSSDQAVMPMDTAFKRRWKFRYVPLNFDDCATGSFAVSHATAVIEISWKNFAQTINKILSDLEIAEDRHLGPFFLNDHELLDPESQTESLTGKLFMYLWDDVLRHGYRAEVFNSDIKTYGQLIWLYGEGKQVFSDKFFDELYQITQKTSISTIDIAETTEIPS